MGKLPPQIVGNMGLYWTCFRLSERGWNVLPTSRNTRGIDIICFREDGRDTRSIQVKSLSQRPAVPLGLDLDKIMGDFWVIVTSLATGKPRTYILTPEEVRARAVRDKGGKKAYWLQPASYGAVEFEEKWNRIDSPRLEFQTEARPDSEEHAKQGKGGAAMEKRHLVDKQLEMRRAGEPDDRVSGSRSPIGAATGEATPVPRGWNSQADGDRFVSPSQLEDYIKNYGAYRAMGGLADHTDPACIWGTRIKRKNLRSGFGKDGKPCAFCRPPPSWSPT